MTILHCGWLTCQFNKDQTCQLKEIKLLHCSNHSFLCDSYQVNSPWFKEVRKDEQERKIPSE